MALLATPQFVWAQGAVDRVRRPSGTDVGKVTATTPLGLTISKGGVETTLPAEEIISVTYAGEPGELSGARSAIAAGRFQEGLDSLTALSGLGSLREEVAAEVDFYVVVAKGRMALAGQGSPEAVAGEVRGFMTRRGKSFHIPAAIELAGDLLVAAGQYDGARAEYAKLAKARSKYFELKSALLLGRAWQAEGDHNKALAEFDLVLKSNEQAPLIQSLRLAATLERAVSQSAIGQVGDATAAIGEIIAKADPEDGELLARAYISLGDCYLKSGDSRGALFAFLHVDLLYSKQSEAHAKALHELVSLWKTVGRDSRSQEAAQQLSNKYPGSRWAK